MECGYTLDEALAAVGFGKFQRLILVYAGIGWFSEAMEIMILSFMGPAVKLQWGLSAGEESLLSSVVFAGILFGAYFWGLVSDNYGRRSAFISLTAITSGTGLISAFAPNYKSLVILRGLVGFGIGGGHVFLSWFLEFMPASHRGKWMIFLSVFWTLGAIFEAALAWIVMPVLSWRWLLVLSAVPSLSLLPFYGIAPESPRFLCQQGRTIEAKLILENMASVNKTKIPLGILHFQEKCTCLEQMPLLVSPAEQKMSEFKAVFSTCHMLISSNLVQTTLLLWVLFFANVFLYYGIILLTSQLSISRGRCSSSFLHLSNLQESSLYIDQLITSFAELPGLLLSAIIVDKFGRKYSMALMIILEGLCLLPLVSRQSDVVTTGLLFGSRMFAVGTFKVASIYAPELYPTGVRSTGAGAASAMGRIGGMICPLVAVALVSECHLKEAVILFEVVIAVAVICILLFPFDTTGRQLDEINSAQPSLLS